VHIQNFKLLKDVQLSFSTDSSRPLSVVRAENASGKTSLLNALRWVLYGQAGVEDSSVRLIPADWPDGKPCLINVALEFDRTLFNKVGNEWRTTTEKYRLIRQAREIPDGDRVEKEPETVSLYRLTDKGFVQVDPPEPRIAEMLPIEMKDVFFTDGDRALTFVSPQLTRATKRDRVREAIRSLLGVDLLERAADHVRVAQSRLTKEVGEAGASPESRRAAEELEDAKAQSARLTTEKNELAKTLENLATKVQEANRALESALQLGKYDELVQRRQLAKKRLDTAAKIEDDLKRQHQRLFESEDLSWALLDSTLRKAYDQLDGLRLRGVIPRAAIPVLQDRLDLQKCICGTPLTPASAARHEVEVLIEQQRRVEGEQQTLTRLFHAVRDAIAERDSGGMDWGHDIESLERNRLEVIKVVEDAEADLRHCEEQLKRIDEADIDAKRRHRDALSENLRQQEDRRRDLDIQLRDLAKRIQELESEVDKIAAKDRKLHTLRSKLLIAGDILKITKGSVDKLHEVYMKRVSDRMSELFLEMVGADPDEGAIFQGASITPDYEIVVHTVAGRTLNPDHEVNGASQRALTFAFIWALTEISGIVAPRVIDTPLGMMTGAVKRRVVDIISRPTSSPPNSSEQPQPDNQVILLLTRSEISQIEDILDARAGSIVTFTNSDHYPIDLVNDPGVESPRILICGCNHHQVCRVCQRKYDQDYGLSMRTA
jgi:DNA sulfur modification protein DndD